MLISDTFISPKFQHANKRYIQFQNPEFLLGVVHIGQVDQSVFFVKVASRLPLWGGVDLIGGRNFCDIRTFQKELTTIGTKNFANGSVSTKIRPVEVGDFF